MYGRVQLPDPCQCVPPTHIPFGYTAPCRFGRDGLPMFAVAIQMQVGGTALPHYIWCDTTTCEPCCPHNPRYRFGSVHLATKWCRSFADNGSRLEWLMSIASPAQCAQACIEHGIKVRRPRAYCTTLYHVFVLEIEPTSRCAACHTTR